MRDFTGRRDYGDQDLSDLPQVGITITEVPATGPDSHVRYWGCREYHATDRVDALTGVIGAACSIWHKVTWEVAEANANRFDSKEELLAAFKKALYGRKCVEG